MPNPNYKKGADKERKIVRDAKKEAKLAFRSAGSHSPIDVCIIDPHFNHITLVQSKTYPMSSKAKQKLLDEHPYLNKDEEWTVSFEIW